MPPKSKFTRDEILNMALCITKEHGIDAVTARELGNRLGSSARPIFTVFENMDEVRKSVILKAKELYGQYVEDPAAHGLLADVMGCLTVSSVCWGTFGLPRTAVFISSSNGSRLQGDKWCCETPPPPPPAQPRPEAAGSCLPTS